MPTGGGDVFPLLQHPGRAKLWISAEKPHQIEKMRAQHQHVLAAGALVLFSPGVNLQELSQQPVVD